MPAALSAESRINEALRSLEGLSVAGLARIAQDQGIKTSQSTLSAALSGVRDLPNDVALAILSLLAELETFSRAIKPIPVSFKNPSVISRLLREIKECPIDLPTLPDLLLMNAVLINGLEKTAVDQQIAPSELRARLSEIQVKVERASFRMAEFVEVTAA